jgi:HAE1 family hydrophobic/amphiphilic exporter-1
VGDKSERVVRVQGKLKSPQDFERIIVARRGSGTSTSAVTLGQLADIRDTQREETVALHRERQARRLDPDPQDARRQHHRDGARGAQEHR